MGTSGPGSYYAWSGEEGEQGTTGLIFCMGCGEPEMQAKSHVTMFPEFQKHQISEQRLDVVFR